MTTQEILQQCTVEGMVVKLPEIKMDRKPYLEVKNSLELIGGKWKGNSIQGFVFEEDPTELLAEIASGEQRNLKKEFQFFATPPELAKKIMQEMDWKLTNLTKIIEPSAGSGALLKAFWEENGHEFPIDCFELMELNRIKLGKINGAKLIGRDFLEAVHIDEFNLIRGQYDYVIANPPFTNNQDIDHILAMYKVCKPGGVIKTLSSCSWMNGSQKKQVDFKLWLTVLGANIEEIEAGAFKDSGTTIATLLITIEKPLVEMSGLPLMDGYVKRKIEPVENPKAFFSIENSLGGRNEKLAKQAVDSGFIKNHIKVKSQEQLCAKCGRVVENFSTLLPKDLCYQCMPEPEEILNDLIKGEKEIFEGFRKLKQMLSPNNQNDMNFFEQLAAAGNVDLSIRILQKGDKLTLNITPGSMAATIQPIIITGTPAELDEGFFTTVFPAVTEIAGMATNLKEVKEEVTKKVAAATKSKPEPAPATEKKEAKPIVEKKPEPVKEVKKVAAPVNDLFGDDDDEKEEA